MSSTSAQPGADIKNLTKSIDVYMVMDTRYISPLSADVHTEITVKGVFCHHSDNIRHMFMHFLGHKASLPL